MFRALGFEGLGFPAFGFEVLGVRGLMLRAWVWGQTFGQGSRSCQGGQKSYLCVFIRFKLLVIWLWRAQI